MPDDIMNLINPTPLHLDTSVADTILDRLGPDLHKWEIMGNVFRNRAEANEFLHTQPLNDAEYSHARDNMLAVHTARHMMHRGIVELAQRATYVADQYNISVANRGNGDDREYYTGGQGLASCGGDLPSTRVFFLARTRNRFLAAQSRFNDWVSGCQRILDDGYEIDPARVRELYRVHGGEGRNREERPGELFGFMGSW